MRPEQLGIEQWHQMTAGYNVLELSTAVKPWLLRHLLDEHGVERVAYFDPDIQVFDSVQEVDDLLREHPLVVNPHLTAPMPRDGHKPAETDILVAGSFNLGFAGFAAGPKTDGLLDWWASGWPPTAWWHPERGYFVDQRWMDFAPGLVEDLFILRDPGYNLAYWNLAGRDLRAAREPLRGGRPPAALLPLQRLRSRAPAPALQAPGPHPADRVPGAARTYRDYAHALERRGPCRMVAAALRLRELADGTPLDNVARAVFRDAVSSGALPDADIFTPAGLPRVPGLPQRARISGRGGGHDPLPGPAAGVAAGPAAGVPRPRRPRRQPADRLGAGVRQRHRRRAPGAAAAGQGDSSEAGHLIPGVNVVGYFKAVLGVGEHARQLVAALESQGVPVHATTLQPHASPEDESLGVRGRAATRPPSTWSA